MQFNLQIDEIFQLDRIDMNWKLVQHVAQAVQAKSGEIKCCNMSSVYTYDALKPLYL